MAIERKIERARKLLGQGNSERAAEIASTIIETWPDTAEAYLIRAQARLENKHDLGALSDCLDGLTLETVTPALAPRFEALILEELLKDTDTNFLKVEALMTVDGSLDRAPRLASLLFRHRRP